MPNRPAKKLFPNPFYLLLLISSTVFVLTTFAYGVVPTLQSRATHRPDAAGQQPGPASVALTAWLDRRGPLVIGVEFSVMLVTGMLAMLTDRWFPEKPARTEGRDPP
jgi:hypothetical protein